MRIYFLSTIVALVLSVVFCWLWIPLLRKWKAGQNILSYVKEHHEKSGTPTMGGVAFIVAALISAFLCRQDRGRVFLLSALIGVSYMVIGILDDMLKRKHKENLGLTAWQKFFFQTIVAIFAGCFCCRAGLTRVYLPFSQTSVDIRYGIVPLSVLAFVATVNAVNLTDGLDGLAAGSCAPLFLSLGVIIVLQQGDTSLSVLAFALTGALFGYLCFNVSPASVFMGDTGSLALGGFAAAIGVFSGNALYLPILGVVFVFSVISVLMQVIYYKVTKGKRIFLMSPAHHHFQKKGFSESKISYVYFLVTVLSGLLSVMTEL